MRALRQLIEKTKQAQREKNQANVGFIKISMGTEGPTMQR